MTGTGLGVLANGMRMFRAIGAADAVAETGAILRRWTYCDARGEVLCATDLAALWGEVVPVSASNAHTCTTRCLPPPM
ncbi:MAG TPA: hypothetical protein VH482_28435 [Thermomicrobiales bacterium]